MHQHGQDHSRRRRGGGPGDGVWDAIQTAVAHSRPNMSSGTVWEEQGAGTWSHVEIYMILILSRVEADPDPIRLGHM